MTGLCFADTNLPVYEHDTSRPEKRVVALEWMAWLWSNKTGRLSSQVLREFYVVTTAKLTPRLPSAVAREATRALSEWNRGVESLGMLESAWRIQDRYQLSWWDALIVAAAQAQDCRYLLSEDLQHAQSFGSVTVLDPFRVAPADIE